MKRSMQGEAYTQRWQLTDSNTESAKKLLTNRVPPRGVAKTSAYPCQRCTAEFRPLRALGEL
ncbi:MAG: hypothetical protein ACYCZJ_01350 [Sulfuriferula sp.]